MTLASDTCVKRCPSVFSPKTVLSELMPLTTHMKKKTKATLADLEMASLLKTLINGNGYKEGGS